MINFVYKNPTKIIFGRGTELKVGEEVRQYSGKYCFIMVEAA